MHEFTTADYAEWPDSFEQSARERELRELRAKQLALAFPPDPEEQQERKEAA